MSYSEEGSAESQTRGGDGKTTGNSEINSCREPLTPLCWEMKGGEAVPGNSEALVPRRWPCLSPRGAAQDKEEGEGTPWTLPLCSPPTVLPRAKSS